MTEVIQHGDAYILRTCDKKMKSGKEYVKGGFKWPRKGFVESPDWDVTNNCGAGLHGFLWGEGDGNLADWSDDAIWIVARVSKWIDLEGKVKFPSAEVVFAGSRFDATNHLMDLGARGAVIGSAVNAGNHSTVTVGYRSTVTVGYHSTVISGYGCPVTAGDRSTVNAGDRSTVTAGYYSTVTAGFGSTVTSGDRSTVIAGYGSTVTAGYYSTVTAGFGSTVTAGFGSTVTAGFGSTVIMKWHDGNRYCTCVAHVGEDGILPNLNYHCIDGKLVPA